MENEQLIQNFSDQKYAGNYVYLSCKGQENGKTYKKQ